MSPLGFFTSEEIAYYTSHSAEMPLVAHYARGKDKQALRITDVIDKEAWMSSDYCSTACLAAFVLYCLGLPILIDASTVVGISFNRGGLDFTQPRLRFIGCVCAAFPACLAASTLRGRSRESESQLRLQRLGLSPRESEVLFWMTEGKLNREIATILGISLGTVQDYVLAHRLAEAPEAGKPRHFPTVFCDWPIAAELGKPPHGRFTVIDAPHRLLCSCSRSEKDDCTCGVVELQGDVIFLGSPVAFPIVALAFSRTSVRVPLVDEVVDKSVRPVERK